MNDLYDRMLLACMDAMYDGERQAVSVDLLQRIVAICAGVAAPVDPDVDPVDPDVDPDDLQFIKASMLRPYDLIWQPDSRTFVEIRHIDQDDVGLYRAEFTDGTTAWYAGAEPLQIPALRAHAHDWNERHRIQQSTTRTDS